MSQKPVCLIIGAGPGIGYSVARKWSSNGHQVVVVRRSEIAQDVLDRDISPGVVAVQADVTDQDRMKVAVDEVEAKYGRIQTLIYNAGYGVWKNYETCTVEEFEKCYSINATGLLVAAKIICPRMVQAGSGVVGITGATAALRGKPMTIGFAAANSAKRMMAQSLARDLGPKNVHVFYTIIDGLVKAGAEEGGKHMDPEDIADTYWRVAQQKRSAWTHEVDMRPFCENW